MGAFEFDESTVRDRALIDMAEGPVTPANETEVTTVITVLNEMLATKIVSWLRYQQHAIVAAGIDRAPVAAEFGANAADEIEHAVWLADRISQLGGSPDFDPAGLARRSRTEYRAYLGTDLTGMLKENLLAERIVIQTCQEIIRWLGAGDPTSRRLAERILEQQEGHAGRLRDTLGGLAGGVS